MIDDIRVPLTADPLYVDDEPWPLYPEDLLEPAYRVATVWQSPRYWVLLALAVVALIAAWRKSR